MQRFRLFFAVLILVGLTTCYAAAQTGMPCSDTPPRPDGLNLSACNSATNFHATPLIDGTGQPYNDSDGNVISLYGSYGNDENNLQKTAAHNHYLKGVNLTPNFVPRCIDGSIQPPGQPCHVGDLIAGPPAIVFLFIGFSNCDIEICGGNSDAWDLQDSDSPQAVHGHLPGQPCATQCPNLNNPDRVHHPYAWNQVKGTTATRDVGDDGISQQSFLYQVYSPSTPLVNSNVVIFDGAYGQQTLDRWDPYSGWYPTHNDCAWEDANDPECNYDRVADALVNNGYSENQVEAVFLKASNAYPQCDLKRVYCPPPSSDRADAETAEKYLGNIMRYLKCCELNLDGSSSGTPRYPNLLQVFVTSRIYRGYANDHSAGHPDACLNPEPFSFELGFAVQRLIVEQINQANGGGPGDSWAGHLTYDVAPWFDWGPYLWANRDEASSSGLAWCNGEDDPICQRARDFRFGNLTPGKEGFYGDYTHPTYTAQGKVATQLVKWITGQKTSLGPQSFITDWVTPWILPPH
ncbi:MAG: hypothetical protein LAN63_17180 [Acidobacteriia bacterium]|nr:hypothetical protein [Terriglobia bacterium]